MLTLSFSCKSNAPIPLQVLSFVTAAVYSGIWCLRWSRNGVKGRMWPHLGWFTGCMCTGSLLGAVLITMIRNGMNLMEVSQFKQMMAIGAVVIVAVWIDVVRRKHLLKK